eukprot:3357479-Rhodomonas_salina.3
MLLFSAKTYRVADGLNERRKKSDNGLYPYPGGYTWVGTYVCGIGMLKFPGTQRTPNVAKHLSAVSVTRKAFLVLGCI